ncbi:hypothetical protein GCM10023084_65300 [Streptomyces lacrimifluminis]
MPHGHTHKLIRLWPPTGNRWGATAFTLTLALSQRHGEVAVPISRSDRLLLVATLDARALQQLAVLLLGHPLAPLLDNRAHDYPRSLLITRRWAPWAHTTYKGLAYPSER